MPPSPENPFAPKFLKQKYADLHISKPVEAAAKHAENISRNTQGIPSIKIPKNPEARIQNYLNRLERLLLDPGPDKKQKRVTMQDGSTRPQALAKLRSIILQKEIHHHKSSLAQSAAHIEERAAHEMGIEAQY